MSLLKQLANSNYISVNKTLIKTIGLEEAVMIGELCSEYDYWEEHGQLVDDGYFYATIQKIEDNTGLSEYQQRKAIKTLENLNILHTKLKGLPATRYFMIDENLLFNFLRTSSEKTKELVPEKLNSSNNNNNKNINKKSLIDKSIKDNKPKNSVEVQTFISLYNEICTNLPRCVRSTDKRDKAIRSIIKKYSLEEIRNVFENANNSDFLMGKNDRGWKANIDFILRDDKFVSILEGKYGGRQKVSTKAGTDVGLHLNRVGNKEKFKEDIASGKAEKF